MVLENQLSSTLLLNVFAHSVNAIIFQKALENVVPKRNMVKDLIFGLHIRELLTAYLIMLSVS